MRQKCSVEEEIQHIITAICLSTVVDAMRSCSLSFMDFQGIGENNSISSVQFSSVAQSCPTLCDPVDCSTPGFPVHQQLQEFTQTHVHRVGDAIQPSHPLLSPSPPAFNLSQHQGLFFSFFFEFLSFFFLFVVDFVIH